MNEIDAFLPAIAIGIGATAFMDIVAWLQNRFLRNSGLNYALVGRWIIGIGNGQFTHNTILQSPTQRYEHQVGWVFHYAIGIFYVGCMLAVTGTNWIYTPNIWNPIALGIASISAPFLIMQPAFGFGLAASKTPSPWTARRNSLIAHLSFGVGIFIAGNGLLQFRLWI